MSRLSPPLLLFLSAFLLLPGAASAQYNCIFEVSGSTSTNTSLYVQVCQAGGSPCGATEEIILPSGLSADGVVDSLVTKWDIDIEDWHPFCFRPGLTEFGIESNQPFSVWLSTDGVSYTQLVSVLVIDGVTYTSSQCGVPTLSEWGMIVLALLAVAAGAVHLRRVT